MIERDNRDQCREERLRGRRIGSVFLHVTRACNLACEYCYFSANRAAPDEFSADDYRTYVWDDIVEIRPEKVVFTGGEPFLRPDLLLMLKEFKERDTGHNITRALNTNGHFVTKEVADQLVGLVDDVRVSIDGLMATNDRLRGAGNFEDALGALDLLYARGFEPKALITLTRITKPDLGALLELLLDHKITRVNINGIRLIGRGKGRQDLIVDQTDIDGILERIHRRRFGGSSLQPTFESDHGRFHCGIGRNLNILPNGDVFPCHVLVDRSFRCGNLREDGLWQILERGGLLDCAAKLDFAQMAREDPSVSDLAKPRTCMGQVFQKHRGRTVWRRFLPLRS